MAKTNKRAFAAGRFQVSLDGEQDTAYIKSVDGGYAKGEVVNEQVGNDHTRFKHVSTLSIEPLSLEIGLAASDPIIKWVSDSWKRKYSRRDGSVLHADFNGKIRFEQWFYRALITETTIPTLDAASKDPVYMSVKLQPEEIQLVKGSGKAVSAPVGSKQMMFTPAQFIIDIDKTDCSGISKVESFTIKQNTKQLYLGEQRLPQIEPTSLEYPDITMEMPLSHADDFFKWYEDYVIKGNRDTDSERDGEISFYDQAGINNLVTIQLKRMGLYSLQVLKSEAASEQIKKVKVQFYVENMDIIRGFGLE